MTISWHFSDESVKADAGGGRHILGALSVGRTGQRFEAPVLSIDMDVLGVDSATHGYTTQLVSSLPVTYDKVTLPAGHDGSLITAQTDDHLFGVMESSATQATDVASYRAYKTLIESCRTAGKPHLLRIWNYVPQITALENGVERYRLFNAGRHQALTETDYFAHHGAPAACALGSRRGKLKIAFLASTRPATPIENSRQISAYNYPENYGIKPPIFCRAAWFSQTTGNDILFLSGTASIVGHQSLHDGDVALQTHETLTNIRTVLEEANRLAGRQLWDFDHLRGQVYVRDPAEMATIKAILIQHGLVNFTYLHADICRAELLVEIEAYAQR